MNLLGLILPWWTRWAVLAALMASCAGFGAWKMHQHDSIAYDVLERRFADFEAKVAAEGQAARKDAAMKASIDLKRKETADADLKAARAAAAVANDGWMRLAASRASSSYLPPAAADSPSPARACVNRAEFERTMGELDAAGTRLAAAGDSCRVDLDAARRWAAGQ